MISDFLFCDVTKKKRLVFIILLITSFLVLVPSLLMGVNNRVVSLFFYLGLLIILVSIRNVFILLFYFLIIALNMYLMYIPLYTPFNFIHITITSIVYLSSIFSLFFLIYKYKKAINKKNDFFFLFFVYIVASVLIYSINAFLNGNSVLETVWRLSPIYLSLSLVILTKLKKEFQDIFLISLFVASLLFTVVAYIELFQQSTFFYHIWAGGERYRNGIMRVGSTLGDPNTLAMYCVPLIFVILTKKCRDSLGNIKCLLLAILMVILVLLTSSRTSLLALLIGIELWLFFNGNRKTKKLAIFLFVLIFLLSPIALSLFYKMDLASSGQRVMLVSKAIDIWSDHFFFGIGIDKFYQNISWMTMNEYVKHLVEFGIIGFFLYLSFYLLFIVFFFKTKGCSHISVKSDAALAFSALMSFAVNSISMDSYFHYIMWILPVICFMYFDINNKSKENQSEE